MVGAYTHRCHGVCMDVRGQSFSFHKKFLGNNFRSLGVKCPCQLNTLINPYLCIFIVYEGQGCLGLGIFSNRNLASSSMREMMAGI